VNPLSALLPVSRRAWENFEDQFFSKFSLEPFTALKVRTQHPNGKPSLLLKISNEILERTYSVPLYSLCDFYRLAFSSPHHAAAILNPVRAADGLLSDVVDGTVYRRLIQTLPQPCSLLILYVDGW
jgi:hypothetical protein